jgi:hypothetical protein
MTAGDVELLREHEKQGETVISWHSKSLWDLRKDSVTSNETALRLSKLLRDNRHALMAALERIARAGHFAFLTTLLELYRADYEIKFDNLQITNHVSTCDRLVKHPRHNKYAAEQKVRRCRVALQELAIYFGKENRSSYLVSNAASAAALDRCLSELDKLGRSPLDNQIATAVDAGDAKFVPLIADIEAINPEAFAAARIALEESMSEVGKLLSSMWSDERYIRS